MKSFVFFVSLVLLCADFGRCETVSQNVTIELYCNLATRFARQHGIEPNALNPLQAKGFVQGFAGEIDRSGLFLTEIEFVSLSSQIEDPRALSSELSRVAVLIRSRRQARENADSTPSASKLAEAFANLVTSKRPASANELDSILNSVRTINIAIASRGFAPPDIASDERIDLAGFYSAVSHIVDNDIHVAQSQPYPYVQSAISFDVGKLGLVPTDISSVDVGVGLSRNEEVIAIDKQSVLGMSPRAASTLMVGKIGAKIELLIADLPTGNLRVGTTIVGNNSPAITSQRVLHGTRNDFLAGYVRFSRSARTPSVALESTLKQFTIDGVDCVVLDLRASGSTNIKEASQICSLFMDQDKELSHTYLRDGRTVGVSGDRSVAWDGPIVVLTDQHTGMIYEQIAGTFKAKNRALVVGLPTANQSTLYNCQVLSRDRRLEGLIVCIPFAKLNTGKDCVFPHLNVTGEPRRIDNLVCPTHDEFYTAFRSSNLAIKPNAITKLAEQFSTLARSRQKKLLEMLSQDQ